MLQENYDDHGFHGRVFQWIESYFDYRKQRVIWDGSASSWSEATSGVPQGSIFGPLFFIQYIKVLSPEFVLVDMVNSMLHFASNWSSIGCVVAGRGPIGFLHGGQA